MRFFSIVLPLLLLGVSPATHGQSLVKDIRPNCVGSFSSQCHSSSPKQLFTYGEQLIFTADDGVHGEELWVSDGTADGTVMLKDISPGASGSSPLYFTVVAGQLFFSATDDTHGRELWTSDGTAGGTRLVRDINPGPGNGRPHQLLAFQGHLVFAATSGAGYEIWQSDGTEAGTTPPIASLDNTEGDDPQGFVPIGDILYYSAISRDDTKCTEGTCDSGDRRRLFNWKFGGSAAPTPESGWRADAPENMVAIDGKVYFNADLYDDSDGGTPYGRVGMVYHPGASDGLNMALYGSSEVEPAVSLHKDFIRLANGRTVYRAFTNPAGKELFADGSSNPVEDIRPGADGSGPDLLIDMGTYVLFRADDGVHGREWWRSDGLTDTRLVKDIHPGSASGLLNTTGVSDVARFGEVLVFAADNGTDGTELWRTDGTEAGTYQVAELQPSGSGGSPASFAMMGDTIYFSAYGGFTTGRELYAIGASTVAGDDVLPVELIGFEAHQDGATIRLAWQTASETNNAGFHVERQSGDTWTHLGYVEGHGTTEAPQSYRFTDAALPFAADRLSYRLRQVDLDGTTTYSSELTVEQEAPTRLKVHTPFPNPARGERITLRYELPEGYRDAEVQVALYDVLGRLVAAPITRRQQAGRREARFRLPPHLRSGLYFVRLTAGSQTNTQRLTVVR